MSSTRQRRKFLVFGIVIAVIAYVAVTALYAPSMEAQQVQTLKVFHAGSLAVPLEEAEKQFEAQYPNVDVQRESMGSIAAIRQVTDVGKRGDVVASADYTLIPSMMYPEYADWVVRFATNDLVLAYNPEKSRYADEITHDNWYEILRRDGVVFAFSNPNLDPCGYRAVMVFKLAELHYDDEKIFNDLILNNTAITISKEEDGTYLIKTPEDLKPNTEKVCIRPKSVELVAYEDFYNKVKVQKADGETITASTVVYGITVPKSALNPELGLEFVKFVIGDAGQKIFGDRGQTPFVPAVGSGLLPAELEPYTKPLLTLATGSPYELGLIGALSRPFEEKYNCKVEVTKAGSGASLDLGKEGKVELVMVHAPEAEEEFVTEGYGLDRTYVMYNDFVIVGTKDDPAGIKGMTDAVEAYKKIAETESLFFSRGDNSGTHKKELSIWESAGITPEGDWYKVTHAFMAATLEIANKEQGYFMTDRSTYITRKRDLDLDILVEGDPVLVNHYHAIAVNPEKHPTVNYELAKKFIDYISSPEGQEIIGDFGKEEFGEPLYSVAAAPTPSPIVMPTSASSPTTMTTPTPSPIPTPTPTPEEPGFEVVFAIAGILAIAYLMLLRRKG